MNIQPFRGLRYPLSGEQLAAVTTPPYDVISPEEQEALRRRHPQNMVRVILDPMHASDTERNNRYTRSAERLQTWRRDGVLRQDAAPSIYLYRQTFRYRSHEYRRYGVLARVKMAEPGASGIMPHERTLEGPKADRFKLLQATRTNLEPIFLCYSTRDARRRALQDALRAWCDAPPSQAMTVDGVEHAVWPIDDPSIIGQVRDALSDAPLFIADGHHRYESSVRFRDAQRANGGDPSGQAPWDYVMAYLTGLEDEGMLIRPIHRLLHDVPGDRILSTLQGTFSVSTHRNMDALLSALDDAPGLCFGLYDGTVFRALTPRSESTLASRIDPKAPALWRRLAVTLLHQGVLPEWGVDEQQVSYEADVEEVQRMVLSGEAAMAILMQSTPAEAVQEVALAGDRLPPKSTYFYPKLITGLVLNPLE